MKSGIVILSRVNSTRIHNKPLQLINGIPIIQHLIGRCLKTGLPVCLGVPSGDISKFHFLNSIFNSSHFSMFCGFDNDPMARMNAAVAMNEWEYGVRVCHDKVFIDPEILNDVLSNTVYKKAMYGILKEPIDGTSFEIIHSFILQQASEKHKDVEHISYAIKSMTNNIYIHPNDYYPKCDHRLLVDFPNDLKVMDLVLKSCSNSCTLKEAIAFLDQHYWVSRINRLPRVSVYTCAHDAEKWICKAMGSVSSQQNFNQMEYIIINDKSKDATAQMANHFCKVYKNAIMVSNDENMGLSSSSNKALNLARGKYIIRLDADDYFTYDRAIEDMVNQMEFLSVDALYPDNYYGDFKTIQKGQERHHVGGSMFRTSAANHVKFTDKLRGYEGLDFFVRARTSLKIGYLERPIFFYRQHAASLSKNNINERQEILKEIEVKYGSTNK